MSKRHNGQKRLLTFGLALALSLCLTACATTQKSCDELWGAACNGMSVDDVLKAIPQSVQTPPKDHLGDGAENIVTGPPQIIDDQTFVPGFWFLQGKLEQVSLALSGINDPTNAELIFDKLVPFLKAKYGTETLSADTTRGVFHYRVRQWAHDGTNIVLFLTFVSDAHDPLLNIVYHRRVINNAGSP